MRHINGQRNSRRSVLKMLGKLKNVGSSSVVEVLPMCVMPRAPFPALQNTYKCKQSNKSTDNKP